MELATFLKLSKKFADLGSSVQQQLIEAADGNLDDQNVDALKMCKNLLRQLQIVGVNGAQDLFDDIEKL